MNFLRAGFGVLVVWAAAVLAHPPKPSRECIVAFKSLNEGTPEGTLEGYSYFLDAGSGVSPQDLQVLITFRTKRLRRDDKTLTEEAALRLLGQPAVAFGRRFTDSEACGANCRALYLALETAHTVADIKRANELFRNGSDADIAQFIAEKRKQLIAEATPPPVDAAKAREATAQAMKGLGINTIDAVGTVTLNGSQRFPMFEFMPEPEAKLPLPERLELEGARMISEQGEKLLGIGDLSVGRTLHPRFDEMRGEGRTPSVPDLLSVVTVGGKTKFRLREAKSGEMASEAGIEKALSQLRSGLVALYDRAIEEMVAGAEIDRLEVVVPERSFNRERKRFGKEISPGRYELLTKSGQPTYFKLEGKAFEVTVLVVPESRVSSK